MNQANKQAARAAIITGAGRRIGAAIARHLHQSGFRVIIHCHLSQLEAEAQANEMNAQRTDSALVISANLSLKKNAEILVKESMAWAGRLDLLVNNASLFATTPNDVFDEVLWDNLFTMNVKVPFWLSHRAYPYLKQQRGSIINLTDIHAHHPLKGHSIYCQTKASLAMQTKSLAREFAPHVRVNAIAPGAIAWPEHENKLSIGQQEKIIAKTPLKQHGNPAYIAQAVLALADNPFITGQTLAVDGGRGLVI